MMSWGFMQGRLSPLLDGRIQTFPWPTWQDEFGIAEKIGFTQIEWTLDQHRLVENPLMTGEGQARIRELCARHHMTIPSLTGDCFMQFPFYKTAGASRAALLDDFKNIVAACGSLKIGLVVFPLVDNGRVENRLQENDLIAGLAEIEGVLRQQDVRVIFESDFGPQDLARFIRRLSPELFGVNYDIGNSAAMGFDPVEEIAAYGPRIGNVHIKDRLLGGTTVDLGTGRANFRKVFAALKKSGYAGNFIMQTARAQDDDHAGTLARYREFLLPILRETAWI